MPPYKISCIMETWDPRVDAYINKSAKFAQPILQALREIVHQACPEVEETIKWSMPFFTYRQDNLCHMAAFKQHCAFGFWKSGLIVEDKSKASEAMGQFGRLTSVKDLPPKRTILDLIKKAKQLNDDGIKIERKPRPAKEELPIPDYLSAALKKNKKAQTAFEKFAPSHRREYIEWLNEARTDATRERRLATALEWIAEGKGRNWKYEKR
jgi:uncharacterized protein YdeI (YjbR/CyaY-like superfamily)